MDWVFANPHQIPDKNLQKTTTETTLTDTGAQISNSYELQEQVRQMLLINDDQYKDTLLNSDLRKYLLTVEKDFL